MHKLQTFQFYAMVKFKMNHRERKKLQTRQALIDSGHALFAQKGYDATTLAEIAERANCAPRTFFQYFRSKEDLLLVGIDIFWNDFAENLAKRPTHVSTLQATRKWTTKITKDFLASGQPFLQVLDHEAANINISAQARTQLYSIKRMQDILIPELAKDLRLTPDAPEPRMLATATAAIFDAYHTDRLLAKTDPLVFMDRAFQALEGAFGSLLKSASSAQKSHA
jgi:AcrR family transcriptional regulator